ncbi:unnamed protein product, partial [Chrysoparadoxa australica]
AHAARLLCCVTTREEVWEVRAHFYNWRLATLQLQQQAAADEAPVAQWLTQVTTATRMLTLITDHRSAQRLKDRFCSWRLNVAHIKCGSSLHQALLAKVGRAVHVLSAVLQSHSSLTLGASFYRWRLASAHCSSQLVGTRLLAAVMTR